MASELIQLGVFGCVYDLKHFGLNVCLDIEYLKGNVEYSHYYNFSEKNMCYEDLDEKERKFLDDY